TLFPYTTLFRSHLQQPRLTVDHQHGAIGEKHLHHHIRRRPRQGGEQRERGKQHNPHALHSPITSLRTASISQVNTPARRSSTMMPRPPETRRSSQLMGQGLRISKKRKTT